MSSPCPISSLREVAIFAPMIAVVLWMGVYPSSFLRPMQPSIANLIERVQAAERAHPATTKLAATP